VTQASELWHDDVLELAPLLRRVIATRVRERQVVEDLVQDTLTRVMAARRRLEPRTLAPHAVVTARNLVTSPATSEDRGRRHAHRLIDLREPMLPEEETLRREERQAITTALARLPERDQEALVAHEVEGMDTAIRPGDHLGARRPRERTGLPAGTQGRGRAALLDDPSDLGAFGRTTATLLEDRERAERLGLEAQRRVPQDYLAPRRLTQELDLIQQLTG
jgi:RNA polymerase sigma factor (sigma-70 family)